VPVLVVSGERWPGESPVGRRLLYEALKTAASGDRVLVVEAALAIRGWRWIDRMVRDTYGLCLTPSPSPASWAALVSSAIAS